MAEIRKFAPGKGEGIQQQVRDLLGENIRPVMPGVETSESAAVDVSEEPAISVVSSLPDQLISIDFDWSD